MATDCRGDELPRAVRPEDWETELEGPGDGQGVPVFRWSFSAFRFSIVLYLKKNKKLLITALFTNCKIQNTKGYDFYKSKSTGLDKNLHKINIRLENEMHFEANLFMKQTKLHIPACCSWPPAAAPADGLNSEPRGGCRSVYAPSPTVLCAGLLQPYHHLPRSLQRVWWQWNYGKIIIMVL